jgi:hypothetical protein
LIALDDIPQGADLDMFDRARVSCGAHPAAPGWIAGRVSVITLVVTPAFGRATPIRQSRVMIYTS